MQGRSVSELNSWQTELAPLQQGIDGKGKMEKANQAFLEGEINQDLISLSKS